MIGWWTGRVRQFVRYLTGRVRPAEREGLRGWLTPAQLSLFNSMDRADQRHGLDVVAALRRAGHTEADLLLAGLLHDAGKGTRLHVWHRVAWTVMERHPRLERWFRRLPTFTAAFTTIEAHVERSAQLALDAGCSPRTAALIRHNVEGADQRLVVALRLADEAS